MHTHIYTIALFFFLSLAVEVLGERCILWGIGGCGEMPETGIIGS